LSIKFDMRMNHESKFPIFELKRFVQVQSSSNLVWTGIHSV